PFHFGAEVQQQQIAVAYLRRRGTGVRQRRPRATRDDRRKGESLAPFVAECSLEEAGHLQLGHAGADLGKRSLERPRRYSRRALDELDLVRVLSLAQGLDEVERRPPLPPRASLHQSLEITVQEMSRFETDDLDPCDLLE